MIQIKVKKSCLIFHYCQIFTRAVGEDTLVPVHSRAASVNTWRWTGADVTQPSSQPRTRVSGASSSDVRTLASPVIRLSLVTATAIMLSLSDQSTVKLSLS